MQGVLIASSDVAVRKSLTTVLQEGRTVYECGTISECLALAVAHTMDYIFIDDVFEDGSGEGLVRKLHALGYSVELIPIVVSTDGASTKLFHTYGVRHCVVKPFDVKQVNDVLEHIEEVLSVHRPAGAADATAPVADTAFVPPPDDVGELVSSVDVREISQRFRRMLARSLSRDELVRAFVDCMQEQFDLDNVVVMVPADGEPVFRVAAGDVSSEVVEQFFIPLDEPLLSALIRFGEPVWVNDRDRLGRANMLTAMRYGERLGVQVLCPVLSRGRVLAIVAMSRFHRYANSPVLVSLVRLFVTFFSKALENADLYDNAAAARESYQAMVDGLPFGAIAVSSAGRITHVNPQAGRCLGIEADELKGQSIEKAGSLVADLARQVLTGHAPSIVEIVSLKGKALEVTASVMPTTAEPGVVLSLRPAPVAPVREDRPVVPVQNSEDLWRNMSGVLAHNFKNALVPVQTCAELLPTRYQFEGFRQSFFDVVKDSVRRMDRWVEQLLRFSNVSADRRSWTMVSVQDCIEAAVEKAQRTRPDLGVELVRESDSELRIHANRELVVDALAEVIGNALEAAQDVGAPRVRIRAAQDGDGVAIEVEDNGKGIDKEIEDTVLQPFATKKLQGLGLGLAFAQKVAAANGGELTLSPAQDGGTCVRLAFPLKTPASAGA